MMEIEPYEQMHFLKDFSPIRDKNIFASNSTNDAHNAWQKQEEENNNIISSAISFTMGLVCGGGLCSLSAS